jgi:hypothetical protein
VKHVAEEQESAGNAAARSSFNAGQAHSPERNMRGPLDVSANLIIPIADRDRPSSESHRVGFTTLLCFSAPATGFAEPDPVF